MSQIKIIKLVNGEEIIGIVEDGRNYENTDEEYTYDNLLFISQPMKITSQYDATTKTHTMYLSDYIPSIRDADLPIEKRNIITIGNPNPDIETHYCDLLIAHQLSQDNPDAKKSSEYKSLLKKHNFDDDDMQ